VPVERVRLDKQTVTEQERVSADVRKEEIEVDDPGTTDRRV
jgi:stress response protein YsnF